MTQDDGSRKHHGDVMADVTPSTIAGSNEIAVMSEQLSSNASWLENYSWDMEGTDGECFNLIIHELRVIAETLRRMVELAK